MTTLTEPPDWPPQGNYEHPAYPTLNEEDITLLMFQPSLPPELDPNINPYLPLEV